MKQILLLSAAYSNSNTYADAGSTLEIGDGKHQITEERALDIEKGLRGEISEVEDTDEVDDETDGEVDELSGKTVPELKKIAADDSIDLGTARTKPDILAAIRAHRG